MKNLKMNIYHNIVSQSDLIQKINSFRQDINLLLDEDEEIQDLHKEFYDYQAEKTQSAIDRAYDNIEFYQKLLNKIYKLEIEEIKK